MRRYLVAATALVLVAGAAAPALASDRSLVRDLQQRVQAGALGSDVTVHVADALTGASIFGHDPDEKQLPASTMKVVTAATSLATLGKDFRFVTSVVRGKAPDRLILVGGGDPMLTTSDLQRLASRTAKALKQAGVNGPVRVALDDFLFPAPTAAPGWAPGDSPSYASGVRALGLLGEYSSDTTASAMSAFIAALRAKGVAATFDGRALALGDAVTVASVDDNTLGDAISLMLRVSENNIAENLFRHVAIARGYPATWTSSSAAAVEALGELGIDTAPLRLKDGSGLSQKDRVTARTLTDILDLVVAGAHPALAPILDWLPVAGETGTLTYRFAAPPASCARDEVFAKTGSLTGVNTLAGLTKGADGRWKSFAVMVNHAPYGASTSLAIDTIAATVHGCA